MTRSDFTFEDELSAIDYLMFRAETSPKTRTTFVGIYLLDECPKLETLRNVYERASREFLRLRQHVVVPTLPVTAPRWVVDPDFDINYHVNQLTVAPPGDLQQLIEIAKKFVLTPLDMSRPLWEVILVEGVNEQGSKAAIISKLHHAVTDGVGAMVLFRSLYDFERQVDRGPMPPLPIPEDIDPIELTRKGLVDNFTGLYTKLSSSIERSVHLVGEVMESPGKTIDAIKAKTLSAKRILGPPPVAPSPVLRRRSLGRGLLCLDFPLESIRKAAKAADASVNDAYIAGICGALRRYHEIMGVPIDALPLAMPVNLRSDDDPTGGNRFAGVRFAAPLGEKDPVLRMKQVREIVLTAVGEPAIDILDSIAPVMSKMPSAVLDTLSESMAAGVDVQASNVPGYPEAPYIAGAKIVKMYPFGPLPGVAMMITMFSQGGECFIGINYDTASLTQPEIFRQCLVDSYEEIFQCALPAAKPRTPPPRKTTQTGSGKARPVAKPKRPSQRTSKKTEVNP